MLALFALNCVCSTTRLPLAKYPLRSAVNMIAPPVCPTLSSKMHFITRSEAPFATTRTAGPNPVVTRGPPYTSDDWRFRILMYRSIVTPDDGASRTERAQSVLFFV